jgi:hypothetical protein
MQGHIINNLCAKQSLSWHHSQVNIFCFIIKSSLAMVLHETRIFGGVFRNQHCCFSVIGFPAANENISINISLFSYL